jgi:predicted O-methyltransferase YrrM
MVQFSTDWFERLAKNNFENVLKSYKETAFNYLEIGTFEGQSLHYVLSNCKYCQATVIDPFNDDFCNKTNILEIFKNNLKPFLDKITIIKGYSKKYLPILENNSFDIIYIDGDHTSYGALIDALLSFPLLKVNGYIIFDDYKWIYNGDQSLVDDSDIRLKNKNNPYTGINTFLEFYKDDIEIIIKNWQVVIRKIK